MLKTFKTQDFRFRQICQHLPKYDDFRKRFQTDFSFFSCLAMAVDALLPELAGNDPLDYLQSAITNCTLEETKKIVDKIMEYRTSKRYNYDTLKNITEKGICNIYEVLNSSNARIHPNEFVKFFNVYFLIKKIPIILDHFKNPSKLKPKILYDLLQTKMLYGYVPIMALEKTTRDKIILDHSIMFGGVNFIGMIFSDPNSSEPYLIDNDYLLKIFRKKIFSHNKKNKLKINKDSAIIFVREKKRHKVNLVD